MSDRVFAKQQHITKPIKSFKWLVLCLPHWKLQKIWRVKYLTVELLGTRCVLLHCPVHCICTASFGFHITLPNAEYWPQIGFQTTYSCSPPRKIRCSPSTENIFTLSNESEKCQTPHTVYYTVRFKHSTLRKRRKVHFWLEGNFNCITVWGCIIVYTFFVKDSGLSYLKHGLFKCRLIMCLWHVWKMQPSFYHHWRGLLRTIMYSAGHNLSTLLNFFK